MTEISFRDVYRMNRNILINNYYDDYNELRLKLLDMELVEEMLKELCDDDYLKKI